jgi:nicotinamide-nucleotide amidase
MISDPLIDQARALLALCRNRQLKLATAESCTGGLAAACLTAIPGSSDVVERGFVTYSNEAKTELIGVPWALLSAHGAVSEPVARAMAEGALLSSRADLAIAITGIAGPASDVSAKPVGLVHLAAARRGGQSRAGQTWHERHEFQGDRAAIRQAAVAAAFALLTRVIT